MCLRSVYLTSKNQQERLLFLTIILSQSYIWLGMRDSNPRSRDQNPLPYRLANPHRTSYYNGRLVSVKLTLVGREESA